MSDTILKLNDQIKSEADQLLYQKGLFNILRKYGVPHVTGSYSLNLMTWRDLDIYLETNDLSEKYFFALGQEISSAFKPVKMHFRNELIAQTKGLPKGLYWGTYLGDERAGAWKIDTWAVEKEECKKLLDYTLAIRAKITPESALHIMNIKSKCWSDPLYRKKYNSGDIYEAVLEKNIGTIESFREYLTVLGKI